MKSRYWILIIVLLFLGCGLAGLWLWISSRDGCTAQIYSDGKCVKTIDLSKVDDPYTLTVSGPAGVNRILVEPGRIRVTEADCPDKICVHAGYIHCPGLPIVCMPNRLVIQISGDAPALDSITK